MVKDYNPKPTYIYNKEENSRYSNDELSCSKISSHEPMRDTNPNPTYRKKYASQ